MLNEVKHPANDRNQRLFSCSAQILRFAQDDKAHEGSAIGHGAMVAHEN
jgi:hypothetical protein